DPINVVTWIALFLGVPYHLFGKDFLSVDHGGYLPIAAPRVEPDPTALDMPTHRGRLFALHRKVRGIWNEVHLEPLDSIYPSHECRVEFPRAPLRIRSCHELAHVWGTANPKAECSPLPNEHLDESLDVKLIVRCIWMRQGEHSSAESRYLSPLALESKIEPCS